MDKYHLACDTITFTKSLHIVMLPVLPFASLPSPSPAVTPLPKGEALAGRKVSAKRYAFINTMKKTTVVKNFRMLETARKLRREMTPQETKLWYRVFAQITRSKSTSSALLNPLLSIFIVPMHGL